MNRVLKHVEFKGQKLLMVGLEDDAALSTKEQYENGEISFCHLRPDGIIYRYGMPIGKKSDIKIIGDVKPSEVNVKPGAFEKLFKDWLY